MRKFSLVLLGFLSINLWGQQVKDSVKTEVIEVTRSFEPKVQDAFKLEINPEIEAIPEKKIPVTYQIQSVPVASTFQPEKGSMAGFRPGSKFEDVYQSYVSFGVGNYTQIKGDAYMYYPVSDQLSSALRLSHYSSQGGKNGDITYQPFYHTVVDALFNYKTEGSNWEFDLGYDGHINYLNENMNFSSLLPIDVLTSKNTYNNFHIDVNGNIKELFVKNLKLKYNNLWDLFDNSEHLVQLKTNFVIPVSTIDLKLGLQTDMVNGTTGNDEHLDPPFSNVTFAYNNFDVGVLPAVQISNDNLVANLGAKIFYQNNNIYNNVQFFPDVNVHLNLIYEKLTVFAGVDGNIKQNSQMTLYQQNPYLTLHNNIIPSLIPYNIFGGFNGAFSSSFSYEVKLGVRQIKNYPFFNADLSKLTGYYVLYDDLSQSYFKTILNIGVGKKFDLKLNMTYLQNRPENLQKTLFIPDFDFKSLLIFKPVDKFNVHLTLHSVGKRNYAAGVDDTLNAYTDLNLGFRYNINKEFTAFLEAYNLLNQDYQIFYNYPVQKLQVLGGVAYKFDLMPKN